jgi:L-fuconolactonase
VDLTSDVQHQVRELREGPGGAWLVGIRHPVRAESDPAWLARDDIIRGVEAVGAAGLAFELAVGVRELPAAKRLCRRLPTVRFVLEHLAAPPLASGDLSAWGRGLLAMAELPNVEATISGLVTAADWHTWSIDDLRHPVELALDAFGPARLMLGSDWPTCLLAGSYADVIESVRYLIAERPANEQEDILGGTATRTYRLDHVRG